MRRAFALLLAVLLVFAASAEAKFSAARICGPSGCRSVTFHAGHELMAMEKVAFSAESRLGASPPRASAWYRVTLCPERCDSPGALVLRVLPGVGYAYLPPKVWVKVTGQQYPPRKGWARLDPHAAQVYRRVAADLEPFPASSLVPLGAAEPAPGQGGQAASIRESGDQGFPEWGWLAIVAASAAVAIALIASARLRR